MDAEQNFQQLLQFFKVLGNKSRLKMLGYLASSERSVGELASLLDVTEPTISHHLSLMKKLGIVTVRAEGTTRIYQLNSKALENMNRDMFSQDTLATLVKNDLPDAEKRVLQAFVGENGRLTDIPSRYKKQKIILKWIVEQLEMNEQYPEPELNEFLRQFHDDVASLRRYMIDHKLMQRQKGIYWRV